MQFRICGHKDLKTKLDDRAFGFPFDRKISFNMHEIERNENEFENQK